MATQFKDYQKVRAFCAQFTAANQGAGNEVTVDVPADSFVVVKGAVKSGFNGTTPTLTVSDGTTNYISGADISSAGFKGGDESFVGSDTTVTISIGGSGSTTGEGFVEVLIVNAELSDGTWGNNG